MACCFKYGFGNLNFLKKFRYFLKENPIALSWVVLFLLYNSALYLIIFYCAAKIRKAITEQMAHMEISKRSGELNGQITRTLLIQVLKRYSEQN